MKPNSREIWIPDSGIMRTGFGITAEIVYDPHDFHEEIFVESTISRSEIIIFLKKGTKIDQN